MYGGVDPAEPGHWTESMNTAVIGLVMVTLASGANNVPATTDNDDSCEITVAPAATLLLPFFDVNIDAPGETTIFTVTNVTSAPQIARVTVWTDWAYPVLTFNLFLAGYDLQSINLYDILARGIVAPGGPGPTGLVAESGSVPGPDDSNPNIASCSEARPPGTLSNELLDSLQTLLTRGLYDITGTTGCGRTRVGGSHTNARGYVTIDVVADCTSVFPNNPLYYDAHILFDNVLIGDYQQLNGGAAAGDFARGSPMVHIRAIPEGGPAGSIPPDVTSLPYTFYDHYTPASNRKVDRRVPLPSTFAARWIENGTGGVQTNYKIWREGVTVGDQTSTCSGAALNSAMPFAEVIRFDERENSFGYSPCYIHNCNEAPRSSASYMISSSSNLFPFHGLSPDVGGWMYLDLDNQPPSGTPSRPSQNWVVISMTAQGRYAFDFDAAHFGNGCTAASIRPNPDIGPAPNVTP